MRWMGGGTFLPPWKRSSASERLASQRQRVAKMGEEQRGLLEDLLHGFVLQVVEDVAQRKAVLLGQRDVQAVVGGGGLQLKVEGAAEAFAQRQSPGLVDAAAEGRVDDQLHAAAFIEEAFGDDGVERGNFTENGAAGDDVFDELFGGGVVEAAFVLEPGGGVWTSGEDSMPRRDAAAGECRRLKPAFQVHLAGWTRA